METLHARESHRYGLVAALRVRRYFPAVDEAATGRGSKTGTFIVGDLIAIWTFFDALLIGLPILILA